ncbi:aminopeptidase [Anaerobacillus isosaccharinicus]|uniref:Aminopeptidase n=1 Tax=Anaerobacillus isosaccharinicus TaxID=1532552 RepID=A0A7S7RB76_9BACI|nr:aminopeptidase [Anaerobacillus isosaccharinicus]MBA5586019.1 aminopeptidase [Anaerobacillus isosaccharinicus]QOY35704.1 aminopeptidase [Anaerobacillus isosaccharinicus]
MSQFEKNLEKYAEIAVKVGINIQKDQTLVINAPTNNMNFVRLVAKKAYEAGAKDVHIEWNDEELTLLKYTLAPDEAFTEFPMWKAKGFEEMAENGAAFMSIVAANPDLLKGVDPERISNANKARGVALEKYRNYVQADKVSWCVIAAPSKEWAQKVFPNTTEEESMIKLWDAILMATRADLDDPVAAWREHNSKLLNKVDYLNNKKYEKLHYQAPGTDLTIELPKKHLWVGGGGNNEAGISFVANMPTEEVFTLPKKDGVNGVVQSTKPLNYSGNVINNFSLTFENGKIVDFSAEEGYETLKRLVETDEGSHYLGEVALVPHDSPISNSNIIFYNTLFDENASSHLAIGNAYSFNLDGGKTMSKEELEKHGANTSITHVDFMIGSSEMNIDGITKDGTREPLFRDGNWAF